METHTLQTQYKSFLIALKVKDSVHSGKKSAFLTKTLSQTRLFGTLILSQKIVNFSAINASSDLPVTHPCILWTMQFGKMNTTELLCINCQRREFFFF